MPRLTFNYDSLLIDGPLTDRRITKYQREGFYGKDMQQRVLSRDAIRNRITKARKTLTKLKQDILDKYEV